MTFEEFCNQPAFPQHPTLYKLSPGDVPGHGMKIEKVEAEKGLTRLDYYTNSIMIEMVKEALAKGLSLNGFTAMQIAKDASTMVMELLLVLYKTKLE